MPKSVENVTVYRSGFHTDSICLACHYDGARYHVWTDITLDVDPDAAIYKNSLASSKEQGYFAARKLRGDTLLGKQLIPAMIEIAKRDGLIEQENKRLQAEEAVKKQEYMDRKRQHQIAEAAPELLERLKLSTVNLALAHSASEHGLDESVCQCPLAVNIRHNREVIKNAETIEA